MVDDAMSFFAPAPVSPVHTVESPVPFVNCCAASSTGVPETPRENWTVIGDDPVLEMGPNHSSRSSFCLASPTRASLVQWLPTPPPLIDATSVDEFLTRTARTQAFPTTGAETGNVEPPFELCDSRPPTGEMELRAPVIVGFLQFSGVGGGGGTPPGSRPAAWKSSWTRFGGRGV